MGTPRARTLVKCLHFPIGEDPCRNPSTRINQAVFGFTRLPPIIITRISSYRDRSGHLASHTASIVKAAYHWQAAGPAPRSKGEGRSVSSLLAPKSREARQVTILDQVFWRNWKEPFQRQDALLGPKCSSPQCWNPITRDSRYQRGHLIMISKASRLSRA